MTKIKALQSIKNSSENKEKIIQMIRNNNMFTFFDDDTLMKLIIKDKEASIIRENSDVYIELNFSSNKEKKGYYKLKETNTTMDLKITTEKILILDKKFEIIYKLYIEDEYVDSVNYKLDWS